MYGNGATTGMTAVTMRQARPIIPRARPPAPTGCYAAAVGTTIRVTCAAPIAATANPASVTTILAFVL